MRETLFSFGELVQRWQSIDVTLENMTKFSCIRKEPWGQEGLFPYDVHLDCLGDLHINGQVYSASSIFFDPQNIFTFEAKHPELGLSDESFLLIDQQELEALQQENAQLQARIEELEQELAEAAGRGQGNKTLLRLLKIFATAEDVVKVQEEFNKLGDKSNFVNKHNDTNELFGLKNRVMFGYYDKVMEVDKSQEQEAE